MASDHFVRTAGERSSRSHRHHSSSHHTAQDNLALEIARQRAMQAAEYYHTRTGGMEVERGTEFDRGRDSDRSRDSDWATDSDQDFERLTRHRGRDRGSRNSGDRDRNNHHNNANGATDNKGYDYSRVNGTVNEDDALRAGVTPASSDAYYKAKLRAGFIDLRNSYNEKIRPRNTPYTRTTSNTLQPPNLGRLNEGLSPHQGREAQPHNNPQPMVDRKGMYRSNSSLELDRVENPEDIRHQGALRRDYGSANSLDVMSTSGDSFFAMLQDYKNENIDQRAPPPPQIHDLLRGKASYRAHPRPLVQSDQAYSPPDSKISNGSVPVTDDLDSADGTHSPKLHRKSQKSKERKERRNKSVVGDSSSGGLFKKLRGSKAEGDMVGKVAETVAAEPEVKAEDRQRRKAVVHYDCQSIAVSLADVIKKKNSLNRRRNITTGASAASGVRNLAAEKDNSDPNDDSGDNKCNDLVLNCPFFRNELGGEEERSISLNRRTAQKRVQQLLGNHNVDAHILMRRPACNGIAILDSTPSPHGVSELPILSYKGLIIEHVDHGAFYYRNFFHGFDHQNFFGIDDSVGPIAISLKREKVDDRDAVGSRGDCANGLYQYRVLVRTSELQAMRGSILEDAIPSSSRLSSSRGVPAKDVLDYLVPEIQLSCLKVATPGNKTAEQLMKLDEQGITKTYKIGIMYCRAGQASEEEMYNNEHAGRAFDEFLDCIGQRVRLNGFDKYRGGLDCKTDSTGTHSLYGAFQNYEIMFHVSTMLPYTPNNKQQLLRKRHIGNDIVTIVFQEPGAMPFTPKAVRSHFQHVFIIVRTHNPNSDNVKYSVAISRSKDVPPFGPPIPEGAMFDKSPEFAEFLLTKAINAENAAHKSDKFTAMATRTRQEYLKDLATNFVTTTTLDSGSKLSKFSLGSGRKKDKPRVRCIPDLHARAAVVWSVQVEDFGQSKPINCHLGIAAESIVLVDEITQDVVFTIPCKSVIGWTMHASSLRLYYDHGECVALRTQSQDMEEVLEIVQRLQTVTRGCETVEMTLRRNGMGQLGFHLHYEGIVADVEPHGFAWQAGLRQSSRLVEICKVATATLTHDQMIDLLRTSVTVKVLVIPPFEDGSPRRGCEDLRSSQHSLNSYHTSSTEHVQQEDDLARAATRAPSNHSSHVKTTRHEGNSKGMTPRSIASTSSGATYPDLRAVTVNLESRFNQIPDSLHGKQASHDSTGSRSSGHGSMEGHISEGQVSRADNISSEGFVSGDDRHQRQAYKDQSEGNREWSGRVTIYPAYRDGQSGNSPSSPRQVHVGGGDRWYGDRGNHNMEGEHLANSYHGGSSAYLSRSAFMPMSTKAMATSTLALPSHHGQSPADSKVKMSSSYSGDGGHWLQSQALSTSNLSDLSSSHSSGGSYKQHPAFKDHQRASYTEPIKDERVPSTQRGGQMSPSMLRRHGGLSVTSQPQRRSYLDASPHSSNSSSPKNARRNHQVASSDENLANRLRPGVSISSKLPGGNTPNKLPGGGTSQNFQEELMRLIDPDVSLAELENTLGKEMFRTRSSRSPGRLQRTLSDESMCSTYTMGRSHRGNHMDNFGGSDVIFTTAVPAHVVNGAKENLTKEQRLSPRVTGDIPVNNLRMTSSQAHSSPMLPLPDAASGLDWNHLVDTATKAFQGVEVSKSSPSSGDGSGSEGRSGGQMGVKPSKTAAPDSHLQHHRGDTSKHSKTSPGNIPPPPPERNPPPQSSVMSWRGGSTSAAAHKVQELESRVQHLQQQLDQEREDRAGLEAEVLQLRQDNVRLQEESQTAAAQLRKFTEWFFNTIDRQ